QGRDFASLESDMRAGYEIVAAGIAIEARQGHPVILADAKDPAFFTAIFKNDNGAVPTRGENRARPPALLRKPTTNVRLSPSSYRSWKRAQTLDSKQRPESCP